MMVLITSGYEGILYFLFGMGISVYFSIRLYHFIIENKYLLK